ncbi:family 78 glycoside hydrolase catalytic domain [Sphingobacterium shayense]|uniref:family 78 glycoside hydrolase catalytic domain n=1 Tax=Sphingobacterium shayense TaxID=626343 RepID=UPI00155619E5|nr:family 78 glycoside hydrolase catalytic domain [Sphingobacterium shayense]NQD70158.1 family 78 glycoside hydrolase catalytic domain [Sphingobacterium shayense]
MIRQGKIKNGGIFLLLTLTIWAYLCSGSSLYANLRVAKVFIEGRENPLSVNTLSPRFSWQLVSDGFNITQQSFRIQVSPDSSFENSNHFLWDSGWIHSEQSLYNRYHGKRLNTGTTYFVRIHVRDNMGALGVSATQSFHIGLLSPEDWGEASWITNEILPDSLINSLPLSSSKLRLKENFELPVFRKTINLKKKLKSSMAYISGLGHYEFLLNGKPVDDDVLQPGWTKYDKEAYYVVYDLTRLWGKGNNTIGILLGNGFYYIPPVKGRFQKHKVAFGLPKVKMKVVNIYQDGSREVIVTDNSWKVHRSPITFSSMYGGEDYDSNILPDTWNLPGYDDSNWKNAVPTDGPDLWGQEIEPVRIMQQFSGKRIAELEEEKIEIYDFSQNASGNVRLKMEGVKGDTVRIYPAELLDDQGRISQKHSGSPYYYEYIFGKDGEVTWHPRFTYYGLRYAEVRHKPKGKQNVDIKEITLDHLRNSARKNGELTTSDTLFNQIHTLINWAIKSNMMSVFTDCPHREKLGWLEQLHLMGPSVQYNFDVKRLFAKSLRDMRQSQTAEGLVPEIAPEYVQFDWGGDMFRDSPEWGSSSIILAWYAYQWYGDDSFLKDNYQMMNRYMAYLQGKAKGNILYQGLGDWYDLGPERPGVSQLTTPGITATAIYYDNLKIMGQISALLQDEDRKRYYDSLKHVVYLRFNETFYKPEEKIYGSGSQTALAMPLYMGLVDPQNIAGVTANLVKDIVAKDTSFTSGDIGHRYLLQVLQNAGRDDLIYAMHKDDTRPGYGYQIRQGATALTESWAARKDVSNNHFMLGHLMEWFHNGLGGLGQQVGSIGYKHIRIAPRLLDKIDTRSLDFQSPYGLVKFRQKNDTYQVKVPVNSRCTLVLPTRENYIINGKELIEFTHNSTDQGIEIELGSGNYQIR